MEAARETRAPPRVVIIADVEENARALIQRVLKPAGIHAWTQRDQAPPPDLLIVDVTQLRGDLLAGLRHRRSQGDEAPAIVLAAHFPAARLRDLFRLGVADILLKPYRPAELCQTVFELSEARAAEVTTQLLARRLQTTREEARRRSEEIRLLSEIGRAVVNLGDLDQILARVVEAAAFVTDAEEANIYLAEPESDEVVLRASKQAGENRATLQRLRITDTLAGQVYRTGQPILRQSSLEGGTVKVQTGFLVQSLVKVPVRVRSKVVGVLGVYNRLAPRPFTKHQVVLLMALADWAGVALEHASPHAHRPAQTPEAAPEALADTAPITAGPMRFVEGLDQAVKLLDDLLGGVRGLRPDQALQMLRTLRSQLAAMRELPLAVLPPERRGELVDLSEVIHNVVESQRLEAARRGLDLLVRPAPAPPLFPGDPQGVQRVLETLVAAAIRRTRRGQVTLETRRFEVRNGTVQGINLPWREPRLRDGIWVGVTVSDTSGGLSPDTIRALTAAVPDHSAGQIGPGLTMGEVRMISERLGGAVWHDQTPTGTTITFALPIA